MFACLRRLRMLTPQNHNRILLPGVVGRVDSVFRAAQRTQAGQALSNVRRNCEEQCGRSAVLQTALVGRKSSLSALCGGHLFSRKKLGLGRGAPSFTAHESNAVNARRRCSVIVEVAAVIVVALFVGSARDQRANRLASTRWRGTTAPLLCWVRNPGRCWAKPDRPLV